MKLWHNVVTTLAVLITIVPGLRDITNATSKEVKKESNSSERDLITIQNASVERDVRPCNGGGTGTFGVRDNE